LPRCDETRQICRQGERLIYTLCFGGTVCDSHSDSCDNLVSPPMKCVTHSHLTVERLLLWTTLPETLPLSTFCMGLEQSMPSATAFSQATIHRPKCTHEINVERPSFLFSDKLLRRRVFTFVFIIGKIRAWSRRKKEHSCRARVRRPLARRGRRISCDPPCSKKA
jgi:hypothetical protein